MAEDVSDTRPSSRERDLPQAAIVHDEETGAIWFQITVNLPFSAHPLTIRFGEEGAQTLAEGLQQYLNMCEEQRLLDAISLSEPGGA